MMPDQPMPGWSPVGRWHLRGVDNRWKSWHNDQYESWDGGLGAEPDWEALESHMGTPVAGDTIIAQRFMPVPEDPAVYTLETRVKVWAMCSLHCGDQCSTTQHSAHCGLSSDVVVFCDVCSGAGGWWDSSWNKLAMVDLPRLPRGECARPGACPQEPQTSQAEHVDQLCALCFTEWLSKFVNAEG